MAPADLLRLVTIAALWGASFMFLRIAAPNLGAILSAEIRLVVAGVILYVYALATRQPIGLKQHAWPYFVIGAVGSGVPFALYGFASMYLSAGLNSIINATSPLYGAIGAAIFLGDRITPVRIAAIIVGALGVWVLAGDVVVADSPYAIWALLAALGAALCYGFGGIVTKLYGPKVSPLVMAGASQLYSALLIAPLFAVTEIPGPITVTAVSAAVALSILASVFGYVLYFQLLQNVGPVRTLYVTFLIPVFGVFWGVVILGEQVTTRAIAGGALILVAVWLETRMNRKR
jgi:drug/metabolite transporter (DMT)-like permease